MNQAEAEKLVGEARRILRSLDPEPKARTKDAQAGLVRILWDVAKGIILWHSPERMEERPQQKKWVGGQHGKKLTDAVERLEKARSIAWNDDAVFLLAEMNFVSSSELGKDYGYGRVGADENGSMEIGRIREIIRKRSSCIRTLRMFPGITRRRIWSDLCMRQEWADRSRKIRQR